MTSDIILETDRLIIRPAREEDADLLFDIWTDPRVMSNVGFPRGLRITREEIRKQVREQSDSVYEQILVVVLKATGQPFGECKMHLPDDQGISTTDVKLLPAFWGHRYGVEVKRVLVGHLFAHTDCSAVQATPNVGNIASIKMQEAVGGVRIGEGTYEFPEEMREDTTPVHHYVYRVHRRGWRTA